MDETEKAKEDIANVKTDAKKFAATKKVAEKAKIADANATTAASTEAAAKASKEIAAATDKRAAAALEVNNKKKEE